MRAMRLRRRQGGMILVMLVLVLAILLAVAAFALDLGRLYVLRSEMQNAVDAAALAAAVELDAEDDAIERARAAATGMLVHNSHFARVQALLGEDVTLEFTFYCSIGRSDEQLIDHLTDICTGPVDSEDPNKILVTSDADDDQAHYVRVTLNPELGSNADNYGIDFYFIPVLGLLGSDVNNSATLTTSALAGRHFYMCNYPPVMMCDPFEGSGGMRANVSAGQQILLKAQGGNTWAPGNFGFLNLSMEPGGGADDAAEDLAKVIENECNPPEVMTSTGGMTNKTAGAVNTRFDIYDGPPPFKESQEPWKLYPPAPNIMEYPKDEDISDANRIGNGQWDRDTYFNNNHPLVKPTDWNTIGRAETYLWEIDKGFVPLLPDTDHVDDDVGPDRRIWYVATLSCNALGLNGTETVPVIEPDGFAKLFVTEHVEPPPNTDIFVEFMGWAKQHDQDYHVVVQLYE